MSKRVEAVAMSIRADLEGRPLAPGERRLVWADPRPEMVAPRTSNPAVDCLVREARLLGVVVYPA